MNEADAHISEAKAQLRAIRDHLPADYSQNASRKLMSSFENYRKTSQALGRSISRTALGIRSEFEDIEGDIRTAIKGTPTKEAGLAFSRARQHIIDDINLILGVDPPRV